MTFREIERAFNHKQEQDDSGLKEIIEFGIILGSIGQLERVLSWLSILTNMFPMISFANLAFRTFIHLFNSFAEEEQVNRVSSWMMLRREIKRMF